jgi:hypothetical protein
VVALCGTTAFAADDLLSVPSGQPVTFHEMIAEGGGADVIHRFRFVAPEIGTENRAYGDVEADMAHLCETFALPRIAGTGVAPGRVVISLSQSETEFGVPNADVVQFFEAYRVENGACILEFF